MNLLLVFGVGFILLLVGTLLGRYYSPHRRPLKRAAEEGRSYIRGLVEVLDGNDDAAINQIISTLKKNTKTVDAYFALGTLFRKQKDFERAVRVHQAILVRRDLDKGTRLKVHRQLALDFRDAGFPRRAAKALEWVVAQDRKSTKAWQDLAALYQESGQWDRAAAALRRLDKLSNTDSSALQAHIWATQASIQLERGDLSAARKSLRHAVSASSGLSHVLHMMARYQQLKGNTSAAAKAWEKALRGSPDLATYFFPLLEQALLSLNKAKRLRQILQNLLQAHPENIHVRLVSARQLSFYQPQQAQEALASLLEDCPSLIPARREAARLVLRQGTEDQIRQALQDLLEMLERAERGFRCGSCGHAGVEMFWRCPRCEEWNTARVAWGRRTGEKRKYG